MWTHSQYAIQKNIELLGDIILQLDNQRSTHNSAVVAHFAYCNGTGYLVHQYLSTGLLPCEVFSEELFHKGEILSSDKQLEVITGSNWIWMRLEGSGQEVES